MGAPSEKIARAGAAKWRAEPTLECAESAFGRQKCQGRIERSRTEMNIVHFGSAKEFREWLAKNYAKKTELWVGLSKKSAGKKGIFYSEALDEALCYGWIDGVRYS